MARRDYALNIIADISDYQRRLSQIPGITDKQAAKAAERLEKRMSKAQEKAARTAKRAADRASSSWRDSFKGITLAITPQDVMSVARSLGELTKAAVDARNQLADAATRTGLTVETLAALRLAAEGSGLQFRELESSLNQFPKRLGDFARGTGEARVALDKLGFTTDDVLGPDGNLAASDEVFRKVLTRLAEVDSQTERAAMATQIFGEAGGKLLQALGDPDALDAYIAKVALIDDRTRNAADGSGEWQRQTADLEALWRAFTGQLADASAETGILDGVIFAIISNMTVWSAVIAKVTDDVTRLAWAAGHVMAGEFERAKEVAFETGITWEETGERIKKQLNAFYDADRAISGTSDRVEELKKTLKELRDADSGEDTGGPPTLLSNPEKWADGIKEGVARGIDGVMTLEEVQAWRAEQQSKRVAAQLADSQAQMQAEDEFREKMVANGERLDQEREQWWQQEQRRQQASRDMQLDVAQQAFDGVVAILQSLGAERKKAAIAAAIAERASAIFSIGVNTARSAMAAFATVQPTIPAGTIAAGLVTAAGAAQAGAVAAQPMPKFHTGTSEVPAMLTAGEAVLNPRAAEMMGRENIDAANRGLQAAQKPTVAVVHWNRRSLDRVVSETVRADGRLPRDIVALGSSTTMSSPYT